MLLKSSGWLMCIPLRSQYKIICCGLMCGRHEFGLGPRLIDILDEQTSVILDSKIPSFLHTYKAISREAKILELKEIELRKRSLLYNDCPT